MGKLNGAIQQKNHHQEERMDLESIREELLKVGYKAISTINLLI